MILLFGKSIGHSGVVNRTFGLSELLREACFAPAHSEFPRLSRSARIEILKTNETTRKVGFRRVHLPFGENGPSAFEAFELDAVGAPAAGSVHPSVAS